MTADAQTIRKADRLILPGWGLWRCHGQALGHRSGAGHPGAGGAKALLGICLGMQLLFEKSYEYGEHEA